MPARSGRPPRRWEHHVLSLDLGLVQGGRSLGIDLEAAAADGLRAVIGPARIRVWQ